MTRACLSDISRLEAREESERTKRAECVAGLWLMEWRIGDTAVEALGGSVSTHEIVMTRLSRTYLGTPDALDILVKVNVVDQLAIDIDRTRLSGAPQDISHTSSTITQPRITTTFLPAIHKRFAEGAVISLHIMDPAKRVSPVNTFEVVSQDQQRGQSEIRGVNIGRIPFGIVGTRSFTEVSAGPHSEAAIWMLAVVYPVDPVLSFGGCCGSGDDVEQVASREDEVGQVHAVGVVGCVHAG